MNELERERFKLHSKTQNYQERVNQARKWIRKTFETYDTPCLNYSGGKDSLVLMHLISEEGFEPDIYHFDNGLLKVPDSDDFVRESIEKILSRSEAFIKTSEKANTPLMLYEKHGYRGFFGWYNRLKKERGWDCRLLGIRAEESCSRKARFSGSPPSDDQGCVAPIFRLKTEDVWSYIVNKDIDYHHIYDKQGELYGKMGAKENRLVTLYDREFENFGSLIVSQYIYPDKTNRLKKMERDGDAEGI